MALCFQNFMAEQGEYMLLVISLGGRFGIQYLLEEFRLENLKSLL